MKIWEELSEDDFHKNVVIKQKKWQTLQSINQQSNQVLRFLEDERADH